MIEDVCPATPPYRHLAALVAAIDVWEDERYNGVSDRAELDAIYTVAEEAGALRGCPSCLAAIGKEPAK